jgi:hypothetical protein
MSTPTTSNRYVSPVRPCRSIQVKAERRNSRCLTQLTASTGPPNSLPERVLTSTKATTPGRETTRSISRWPLRKRRWTTCQPRLVRYRSATRSPVSPRVCVCVVTAETSRRLPLSASSFPCRPLQKTASRPGSRQSGISGPQIRSRSSSPTRMSRGFEPLGGPSTPAWCSWSIIRAARP